VSRKDVSGSAERTVEVAVSRPGRALFTAAAVTAVALGAAPAATAHAGRAAPAHPATRLPVVAPYVDVSLSADYGRIYGAITAARLHAISAGFVVAATPHGCTPEWGGDNIPLADDNGVSRMIRTARSDGASVIVSFGGASGNEIATKCTNTKRLTAAYRSVIDDLKVTHVDFDIEGAAIAQPASIRRRFAAIHSLEAHDHHLAVSLTVPVTPRGLDRSGVALLKAARRARARVDLLNVMTMDYGGKHEMGTTAITVAKRSLTRLRRIDHHATYRNIGVTPMIGQNDVRSEVFSTGDARRVVRFARLHRLGRLAFWSLNRDQQCPPRTAAAAQDECSGVAQPPLKFTHLFAH
jgi:chitinase